VRAACRDHVRGMTPPKRTETPWGAKNPSVVYLGERQALLRAAAAAVTRSAPSTLRCGMGHGWTATPVSR